MPFIAHRVAYKTQCSQCECRFNGQALAEISVQIPCNRNGVCKGCANRKSGPDLCKSVQGVCHAFGGLRRVRPAAGEDEGRPPGQSGCNTIPAHGAGHCGGA